jgi:alpha-amylase/alpha-mannosidase (GH57 family)
MENQTLYFAVVLHMHQPRYNLTGPTYESDVARDVFNQTLHPYTYPADILKEYENARVTLNFTGSLIEQLNELQDVGFDPRLNGLWSRYREVERLGRAKFTGSGYFHPIFPLIPDDDRRRQIEMHLKILQETFGEKPKGFWLPELAFSMKVIHALAEMGIKWTIVDGDHLLNANKEKDRYELMYKPHYVEYNGKRIIVIPRDRNISNAQQSGYNPVWLKDEIKQRVQPHNDGDFLLTVATDGENGWFRHSGENAGFWGWFFEPLAYLLNRDPDFKFIQLTTIDDYLDEHPPQDTVVVEDGSWNVPDTSDDGRFLKWTEGDRRQKTWTHILETSKLLHQVDNKAKAKQNNCPPETEATIQQAWRWLLLAEASDNFWWGTEDWLNRSVVCSFKAREKVKEISKLCGFT